MANFNKFSFEVAFSVYKKLCVEPRASFFPLLISIILYLLYLLIVTTGVAMTSFDDKNAMTEFFFTALFLLLIFIPNIYYLFFLVIVVLSISIALNVLILPLLKLAFNEGDGTLISFYSFPIIVLLIAFTKYGKNIISYILSVIFILPELFVLYSGSQQLFKLTGKYRKFLINYYDSKISTDISDYNNYFNEVFNDINDYHKSSKTFTSTSSFNTRPIIYCPVCDKAIKLPNIKYPAKGKVTCSQCATSLSVRISGNNTVTISIVDKQNYEEITSREDALSALGLTDGADMAAIKAAYKKKISEYHPDKVAKLGDKLRKIAEQESKRINTAYDFLAR